MFLPLIVVSYFFFLFFLLVFFFFFFCCYFFFQAEDGIRDLVRSRGLGDVYKRQVQRLCAAARQRHALGEQRAGDDPRTGAWWNSGGHGPQRTERLQRALSLIHI
mgnify:CR=1 FL=1